jgi:hypothetical protein
VLALLASRVADLTAPDPPVSTDLVDLALLPQALLIDGSACGSDATECSRLRSAIRLRTWASLWTAIPSRSGCARSPSMGAVCAAVEIEARWPDDAADDLMDASLWRAREGPNPSGPLDADLGVTALALLGGATPGDRARDCGSSTRSERTYASVDVPLCLAEAHRGPLRTLRRSRRPTQSSIDANSAAHHRDSDRR